MTIEVFPSATQTYPVLVASGVNTGTSGTVAYLYPFGSYSNIVTSHYKAPAPTTKVNALCVYYLVAGSGAGSVKYELYKNGVATGLSMTILAAATAGIHKAVLPSEVTFTAGTDSFSFGVNAVGTVAGGHGSPHVMAYYEAP